MKFLHRLTEKVHRAMHLPVDQLHRWQLALRYAVGTFRLGQHQLYEDRAGQMAAALTYRTIFSLIPMFVIGLIVFNAFGGFGTVREDLQGKLYNYLGLSISIQTDENPRDPGDDRPRANLPPPPSQAAPESPRPTPALNDPSESDAVPSGSHPPNPQPPDQQQETKQRVDELISDLTTRVSQVSIASIGMVGIGVLIWASISLVVSLEDCFNRIFRAPEGRPWHLRISIYWAVITLGPVLVATSFWFTGRLIDVAESVAVLGWVLNVFTPFASLAATWLLLMLLYTLLPNIKVEFRSAVIGAFVGAVLWELSKWGFRFYLDKAVGYSALYGSLGLVPLFLLWLYLTWLVILFGLEITYVLQTLDVQSLLDRPHDIDERPPGLDHTWILPIAAAFAQAFEHGQARTSHGLAKDLGVPAREVDRFATALCKAGFVHQIEEGDEEQISYSLSRPASHIAIHELLDLGRATCHTCANNTSLPAGDLLQHLHDAERAVAGQRTLAELLPESDEAHQ